MTITTTYEAVLNIIRARLALDISLADNTDAARLLCDDSDAALRSAIDGAWPAVALALAPLVDEAPAEPLTMEIGALDVLPRGSVWPSVAQWKRLLPSKRLPPSTPARREQPAAIPR